MILHVIKPSFSKRSLAQLLVLAFSFVVFAIALSESASADLDTFTTGDGHEGAVTVSTSSVLNYSAPLNAAASAGANSLTTGAGRTGATGTSTTTGSAAQTQFEANRLALVIQSSNYTGSAPSGDQTDIDLSSSSVGRWELARISSISGSLAAGMTVNFYNPLVNSYAATGAQIVAVPEFTTVQINGTRSWSANSWNGTNGGITAFLATGAVNLSNASSSINANGDGFRGGLLYNGSSTACTQLDGTVGGGKGEGIVSGVYPGTASSYASRGNIANGGGGGVCENSGGGGGGNGGQGGIGGLSYDGNRNVGGLGGSKLDYSAFDHAIFGGGGGAGDENNSNGGAGGNGGGFVFVRANSLTGAGTISATGNDGADSANVGSSDAAGGGGAGGVVYARFNSTAACGSVTVRGGAGGDEQSTGGVHGPGGGGAGGRLILQSSGGTCPTTVANGVGGTVPNGGGGTRGSGPTSSTDATSSGATEAVPGGGGITTPTAAVTDPADGVITNDTTPTITGNSSMNAGTIRVTVDGAYVGSATTAGDGTWSYVLPSALSAGAHSYTVRPVFYGLAGTATASRTINIDLTPPGAPTVSSNRTGTVAQTTASITYIPAEGGGTMQCSLDGGAYATCAASPVALSGLADGNHSYAVRQVDAAGNIGSASTAAWVVDTTAPPAPTVTRTSPASSPTNATTAQIAFSANEAGGTLQCSVDGGAYATCAASPANLSSLANGAHSYAVRQVDVAGNTGAATTVNWTIDTIAPAAPTVTSDRTGTVAQTTASITYTPAEGGGTMQCSLDGGAYATCAASPVALSGLADGSHSYAVRQVDAAGNSGSATTVAWVVDTAAPPAPTVTRTSPASTPTALTTAQIAFSANEAGGTLQCSVDGGAYATCAASPANLSSLADGPHSYSVRQQDTAGNTSAVTTVNWVVDTVAPPAPTVSSNRTGTTNLNTAQVSFSANEASGTLQCSVDGGAFATCAASPVSLSGLADGSHSFAVRQVDAAGNTGSATTVAWVVDTLAPPAPTVTRTSPASTPTALTTAQIAFSANEAGGTLQCSADGGAYAACGASPANLSGLTDGPHSYAVRQVDAGGNNGAATTVNWTVDTAAPPAPTVTRVSPASTPTQLTTAQVSFSANEGGGTLQCSADGGAYAACAASPANLSGLTNGAHSYAVRHQDAAGNTSPVTTVNWTVDTLAPAAPSVSSNRTGTVNLNTATITYTAAEGGGTMQCSADGGAYATCGASPVALSSLADGSHSYAVRQVDAAGNTGSATTVAWVIDTAPPPAPTVTRTSPTSTPTQLTSAQITFSANEAGGTLQCSADGGAYATCAASPVSLSGLADGSHSYAVRQVDAGTNVGPATTVNWTVDTVGPVAPTVTRTSPASSPTNQTTAQITYLANEGGGTLQCSVDGGAYAACGASPANLASLTDGTHSYAVRQVDAAGNNGAVASVSWVIDTTGPVAPTVTRTSPASSPSASTTAQITFSANEGGGTLQCSTDGGAYTACGASPANLSALADGSHSFAVRQLDGLGNIGSVASVAWVVDTSAPPAPTVTRTSPPSTPTSLTSAQIAFAANEAGGTLQCSVDGGAYATCGSSPANLSGLSDGAHSYAVRQQDVAGNTSPITTVNWVVDTIAPNAPGVSSNRTGTTSQTTATITYTPAEGGGTVQCSVDGGAFATCTASPVAVTGLGDGAHTYAVRQIDAAGNIGSATTAAWTVDTIAPPGPTVTRTAPATTPTNSTTAQIAFSANEGGGTLECSVDGGTYSVCAASPTSLSGLADGAHSYAVRQVDSGGNTGTSTTVNWVVDTTPPAAPTVTRTSPASTPTTLTTAQIAFSANEGGGTLQCSVDAGAFATCAASPTNLSGLADGGHSYAVRQLDAAGNIGSISSVAWVVDTTAPPAPTVTRTSPASTPTQSTAAQISFSANEGGGTLQCSVDGGAYATCGASPANLSSLPNGAHSYAVRQQDAAGNIGQVTTVNWVVDTIAPAAPTVSSNRTGTVNVTTATITYTAAEGGGTMTCSVDGGPYAACTASPISLSALADGNHSYAVRQTDAAGNVGSSSSVAWIVDTVAPPAPTVTRTSPAATPTSLTTAQVTFSANEAGGTLQCSVDGGAYATCGSSPASLSGLTDGAHSYSVRQVDAGTNTGPATTVNWTVDTAAPPTPTVTRTSPASTPTSLTTAQITYSANEAGGTLQCAVDGGAYAACGASPANLSGLTDGAHSYAVRQVDAAGNTGSATTVNWTVDTTPPPAPTVASNRTGTTNLTTAQVTFSANEAGGTLQCSVDGGSYATCAASPVSLSGLTDGGHSYAVRQVDAAGNTGSATTVAWTVDTVAPVAPNVTRTSPASTPTSQTAAQITFSANEGGGTLQCSVDGGAYSTCGTSPTNLSSLTDGAHSYAVRQVDAGSNTGPATTVNWVVDTIAPAAPSVSSNRTGTVNLDTATITYGAAEGGGTIECSIDGGAYASCSASPVSLTGLADGARSYSIRQVDAAGNTGSATTVSWTVDTAAPPAPTVTRTSPTSTPTSLTAAEITYSANEAGGTLQCSVDGGAYAPCGSNPANLTGLTDGAHSYSVRQIDAGTNVGAATTVSWTVDTAAPPAPTVTRTVPASTPTTQTSGQISFGANEAGGTLECSADGASYTSCGSSPANLSGLTDGVHSYAVRQVDAAGNTGAASSVSWTVDTTPPPAPTVSSNRSGTTNLTSAQITFSANEAGGTLECSADGGVYAACGPSPVNLSSLADGNHSYAVRQVDAAGNTGSPTTVAWTVDTDAPPAPTVARTSPTSSPSSQTTAQITFSANEAGGTLECAVDGGSYATCGSSPANLSGLTDGAHSYAVRQVDAGSNTGPATTVNWVVDTIAPAAPTVNSSRTGTVNETTALITYTAAEGGGTIECSVDGGTYEACSPSPNALHSLADGVHSYAVRQVDAAGNTGSETTVAWTVDTATPPAPTVTRTTPTSSPTSQTTAQITFSANEAGGTLQCAVDGGSYAACGSSPASLSGLADGPHSYSVRQVDAGTNTGPATTVSWTVDTVAPVAPNVTLASPTSTPTNETTAQIIHSANEAGGTLECSVDGGAYATCGASPASLSSLTDGTHSYAVRQVDDAGNTGAADTVGWTVDTAAPPAPTVNSDRSGTTSETTAEVTFVANEAGGALECSIDGGTYATCGSSPATLSSLSDGPHSYAVRQIDTAGNTGSTTTVSWIVDTIAPPAPTVTRTAPTASPTSETTAEITFTPNESGGTLECSVDGGAYATCAGSPATLSGLADGPHSYAVRQVDAGNNTGASASVSWTVDTVAPSAPSVSSNRTGTVGESTAEITYTPSELGGTLECSLDGAPYAACTSSPIMLTGLADGPHTYSVRQLDDAGNADSASTVAWIVDLTAPGAPIITSPTGSPHYSATATPVFSGTAEPGSTVKLYDGATLVGTATADGSGDWSVATDSLADGAHSIVAAATDPAGNSGAASAPASAEIDTIAPTVAISAPVSGGFINTTVATVSFSVTDANPAAASICQVDGGSFDPCTSGFATATLSSGSHTVTVQHTDLAGNTGSSSSTFTVDSATPLVSISSPTAFAHIATAVASITFAVLDDNAAASSDCSVDGAATVPCTSAFSTNPLSDGDHTVTVSNTDSAGNTGSASINFTVDTQAPNAPTITDAPADPIASDEAEFGFTGSEISGDLLCALDAAPFTACTSPVQYLGLADGIHEFQVTQRDEAGNISPAATHNWTVDTTPPSAPTLNGPNAHTNNPESTVSFAGSPDTVELRCSFNGGAFSTCPTSPLSLGELPDGNYSFTVEAFDAAGNSSASTITWEVDTVAPGAPTITAGPVGSVPSPDAQFSFTGAEGGGVFRCSLDSQPAVTCVSPFDVLGLVDGTYTFRVRQVDAAGNVGPMVNRTWTVDTTPPPAPTVSGPSSPSGQTSALIDFSSTEPGVTYECSVDGGSYAACADPLSLSGLVDGAHTVDVRSYDAAGNGSAIGSFAWTVDHSLYTADIGGAPSGVVSATGASMTLSASLPGSTFQCSLDGAPFSSCSSPVSISNLAEGDHTFALRASVGAQDAPEVTRSWTIDLTNPSVTITAPLASSTTGADTSIAFTANDLHAPITTTCKLDSAAPAPCTSPQAYTNLAEGNHTVVVSATDAAGNSGNAAVTWHVDNTAPSAPLITAPAADGSTANTTPTVGGTAEAGSTVKLYDGAALLATLTAGPGGAWSWTPPTPLAEATYNFHATATDINDNTGPSSATRTLTVDVSSPSEPVITAPAAGPTNDSTPLVSGTAEPGATVTVHVDGNPVSGTVTVEGDGTWQKTISPALTDGPHTITAIAVDTAGNTSPPAPDLALVVDTAAPSVAITSPAAAAQVNTDSPAIAFTAEPGSTTRCKLDTDAYASCTSPFAASSLTEGPHTATVEATDGAGNVATAVVTFSVDLTDPTAQLTGGPSEGGDSSDDTPTFTFTSNEPGTFECSIDGGTFASCSSPFTLPAMGDGTHSFTIHSVDQAGNESADVTRTWTVDTTAPSAPSIDTPSDGAVTADSTPTVTGNPGSAEANSTVTIHIDGTAVGTTTAAGDGSWSFTAPSTLVDNNYAFTAKATDAAGNISPVSATVDIRVDGSDPTAQITAKPGALSSDSTPTFGFTADEPGTFECRIDSGAYSACTSPFTTATLADGPHSFFVRALDASSNVSAAEEWDWTIDTTAPDVTVTSNTPAAGVSPTFSFASSESGTTYKCRIDGSGAFTTCSSPFNAPTLSVGSHTLEVQYTDSAGNTGTRSVNFSVTAPSTPQPPTTTPRITDPTPNPPTAPTCTGAGDEPGIPANMTVLSAVAKKNVVKFTTSSDKYILVRVSIYDGRKLVGTAVRANNPGKRIVAIKTKKALPKNKRFTIRLSAITMSGGKSVAGTNMVTDKKGKTTLVGADGTVGAPTASSVDCAPEKGAKKIKFQVASKARVKVGLTKLTATAKASDWSVATFRVIQNGKTIGRRVFLLKPGKKLTAPIKVLSGNRLAKGRAIVQVSTCSVDGVWQVFKKPFAVK
ncbi:MAG: hypothetical protein JHC98_02790 [Thermoleophilaceae bacterium]|nr:hypothetical protein [Thermoleophilaceae bacterium]